MKNWEQAIFDLASSPGVVMVVGAADTGKSTFCLELLRTGFENGVVCAFVDADVGQSDLGPPCTVSMSLLSKKCDALSDLPSQKMAFVGSTSPAGHFLECVNGTKQMVDAAAGMGAELIVVNTTGLVDGYAGRKLKTHKINLIRPNYLVGLQKKLKPNICCCRLSG